MRSAPARLALFGLLAAVVPARAQMDPHHGHHQPHRMGAPVPAEGSAPVAAAVDHSAHHHEVGPAGRTDDLRMREFLFDIGQPGVAALVRQIWRDQAQESKAMGQWRKAGYPGAPVYPVALNTGGDPNSMESLEHLGANQIKAMRMMGSAPTRDNRVTWFFEGMIAHHGGALVMAPDALRKSTNPTLRPFAGDIIVAQRRESIELRRMLNRDGFDKPEDHQNDALFSF